MLWWLEIKSPAAAAVGGGQEAVCAVQCNPIRETKEQSGAERTSGSGGEDE